MLRKIAKIYPLQIEIIPLVLVVWSLYLTLTNYPLLPYQIPTHFNIQGLPDGWGNKSEILVYSITGFLVYVIITVISIFLSITRNPKSLINLPGYIKDKITPEQAERLRVILVRCLVILKILILGQNLYLLSGSIETALGKSTGIGDTAVFIFTAGIIMVAAFMVYKSFRIALSK
jgi:uncharacterized membrane protein